MNSRRLTNTLLAAILVLLAFQTWQTRNESEIQAVEIFYQGRPLGDGLRPSRGVLLPVRVAGTVPVTIN